MVETLVLGNLNSTEGLKKLDDMMRVQSYIRGSEPSSDDIGCYTKIQTPPNASDYPHAYRWYRHISTYLPEEMQSGKVEKEKEVKEDEDDFDLFGEETEEDKAAAAKIKEKAKEEANKKKRVDKSTLVIEIKPAGTSTNLDEVEKLVRQIAIEGLEWGKVSKKVPMAFGLFKLQIGCTIVDDLIDTDGLVEKIVCVGLSEEEAKKKLCDDSDDEAEVDDDEEEIGFVQSAEIVSFNKL